MAPNLDHLIQRTRQYWTVDGLTEIVFSGVFLILGLYFFAQEYFGESSTLGNLLQAGLVLVLLGVFFGARRLIVVLKAQITYPRSGYLAYQQPDQKNNRLSAAFGILVASVMALFFLLNIISLDWMPAITGALVGLFFFLVGFRLDVPRFYALSLASVLIGIGLSLAGLGNIRGLAVYYLLMSLPVLLTGSLTLRTYLSQYKATSSEE